MHPLEWSIGRDPEQFPAPDSFNPKRWLESEYPTYQEPLSKYPTITNYSQFGYGRRVCTGMGVAEADLFVGIGSMAWMFSMSADGPEVRAQEPTPVPAPIVATEELEKMDLDAGRPSAPPSPPPESEIEAHLREKFPMSRKDTLLGKGTKQPSDTSAQDTLKVASGGIKRARTVTHRLRAAGFRLPGQFPAFFEDHAGPHTPPASPKRIFAQAGTEDMPSVNDAVEAEKADPTLEYSSLLIAKPLPFKFNMQIRDRKKAEFVAREWMNLKMEGELVDSRCYWQGGNSGNAEHGWGVVHK